MQFQSKLNKMADSLEMSLSKEMQLLRQFYFFNELQSKKTADEEKSMTKILPD